MSKDDCKVRFCPTCEAETPRKKSGKCKPCGARRQATYRAKHPEKVQAGIDAWRAVNKAKINANSRKWAAVNKERHRLNSIAWKKANPDAARLQRATRRARMNGGVLSKDIVQRLMKLQRGKCACCRKPLGKKYHIDHIMPLAKGGTNTDENVQLLRSECNHSKNAMHPVDYMQRKGFLL